MSVEALPAAEYVERGPERLRWCGPGLGLEALGLTTADELFAPGAALSTRLEPRAETGHAESGRACFRFPLPGTPDARGNLTGRPAALGTGWLWLTVFRASWTALVRARCTHPRSASLAEREWNLLCHLRAHGIGTPEPLLVGARGAGLAARRSFLLVRAPEDAFPLPRWLRTDGIGAERERGFRALAQTLAALVRSGTELPELRAEHLWLTPSGAGECDSPAPVGPRRNRLPSVILTEVGGGRLRVGRRRASAPLERLLAELETRELCTPAERARLAQTAAGA